MAIVFALMTAIAYGFDHYFIRRGLIKTPYPMVAAFVTLTINFFFFVVLSWILEPLGHLRLDTIYFFVIAGILAPGLARVLSYKGLEKSEIQKNTGLSSSSVNEALTRGRMNIDKAVETICVAVEKGWISDSQSARLKQICRKI